MCSSSLFSSAGNTSSSSDLLCARYTPQKNTNRPSRVRSAAARLATSSGFGRAKTSDSSLWSSRRSAAWNWNMWSMGPTACVEVPASAPDRDRLAGGWFGLSRIGSSLSFPESFFSPGFSRPRLTSSHDAMSVRSGPCSPSVGPLASTGPTTFAGTDAMNLSTSAVCSCAAKASSMSGTRCACSLARCCARAVLVACAVLAARWMAPCSRSVCAGPPPSFVAMSSTASSSAWVMASKRESSASCSSSYAWATLLTLAASAGRTTSSSAATCARYVARTNPHRATSSSTSALSDFDTSASAPSHR